jgi:hypothetical protein
MKTPGTSSSPVSPEALRRQAFAEVNHDLSAMYAMTALFLAAAGAGAALWATKRVPIVGKVLVGVGSGLGLCTLSATVNHLWSHWPAPELPAAEIQA